MRPVDRLRARSRSAGLGALVVLGAVLGALGPGAPTGVGWIDLAERMALGAGVAVLATRAGPAGWLWFIGWAALFGTGPARLVALGALLALVVALVVGREGPEVGTAAVVCSYPSLLVLAPAEPRGLSAALAGVAVVGLAISAVGRLSPEERRRLARRARVPAAVVLVVLLAGVVVVALAAYYTDQAVDRAKQGLTDVQKGEMEASAVKFDDSADRFGDALLVLSAPVRFVSAPVPVLHQHVDATYRAASEGRDLVATAAQAAGEADLEEVRIEEGRVDLEQVAALEAPLERLESAVVEMEAAVDDIDTTWLLVGAGARIARYDRLLARARHDTHTALEAVRLAPALLGHEGERTYILAFTTPAEARGTGGLLGSFAELRAVDGRLELVGTGRSGDFARRPDADEVVLEASDEFIARYGQYHPEKVFQDVTLSPDFPAVAGVIASVYRQATGTEVDGVLLLDPFALEAFVGAVGGIDVPELGLRLTGKDTADFLLREQYEDFDTKGDRVDALSDVADATMDAFLGSENLPPPPDLVRALARPVAEDRLLLWFADPAEEAFAARIGVDGAVPRAGGEDYLGVVVQNGGNNKLDTYLYRTIDQRVVVDTEEGEVTTDLTVTLDNRAPAEGLPDYVIGSPRELDLAPGTSRILLTVYSPLDLRAATVDGRPVTFQRQEEFGGLVHSGYVEIPSRSTVEVDLVLAGPVDLTDGYRLRWESQPLVHDARWLLSVSSPTAALRPAGGIARIVSESTEPVPVREDLTLDFEIRPREPDRGG